MVVGAWWLWLLVVVFAFVAVADAVAFGVLVIVGCWFWLLLFVQFLHFPYYVLTTITRKLKTPKTRS